MTITIPQSNDYALDIKFKYVPGWEQWIFLTSDVHKDSPECLDGLLREHLELAKDRKAMWIDNGDLVDVIASVNDRRGTKGGVRKEHQGSNYLDLVEEEVAEWFKPYAGMLVYAGRGNHDAKIIKLHETDILRKIINRLSADKETPIHVAGYGGWIVFRFEHESGGRCQSVKVKLFHGSGGGGEVTKGVMEAQRMGSTIGNADIVVTGHVHERWQVELVREEVDQNGRIRLKPRTHLKLGSYKMDYRLDGEPTWHMQRPGGTPKPLGGAFIRFYCEKVDRGIEWEVRSAPVDYRDLK